MTDTPDSRHCRVNREEMITAAMAKTGKTREQIEAFLAILRSGFARRGLIDAAPMSEEGISHNLDEFLREGT